MTQIFDANGTVIPVTVIQAGPCVVSQVKTLERDKYTAVQLAFEPVVRDGLTRKPEAGHFKNTSWKGAKFVREFRLKDEASLPTLGAEVKADIFANGEIINLTSVSKGKGFLGVVGRHGFAGGPQSHGSMSHRRPGSIGAATFPGRVIKGRRMGGQTGNRLTTIRGLTIARVVADKNLLLVRGAVPGSVGTYVYIAKAEA